MKANRQGDLLTAPEKLDYQPAGMEEMWRVEKFRDLVAEFTLLPGDYGGQMAVFHQVALQWPRPWDFVRRLFGVNPVFLPAEANPEDYRRLTRAQLCAAKGITNPELRADLDQLRAVWTQMNARRTEQVESREARVEGRGSGGESAPPTESELEKERRILRESGFDERMFEQVLVYDPQADETQHPNKLVLRPAEKNRAERSWFVQRCVECRTMLAVPLARMRVRDMLQNELNLLRMQDRLALLTEGTPEFERLDRRKGELQNRYEDQLDKLQEMFPEMHTANRVSYRQSLALLFEAEKEFYADGNNQRRTFLFTLAEIEFLARQSLQQPAPQYLLSIEFLAMEAMHGLYDRNFRSQLEKKPRVLKLVNSIGRAAIDAARQAAHVPLTDLEAGVLPGEEGTEEFEELTVLEKS